MAADTIDGNLLHYQSRPFGLAAQDHLVLSGKMPAIKALATAAKGWADDDQPSRGGDPKPVYVKPDIHNLAQIALVGAWLQEISLNQSFVFGCVGLPPCRSDMRQHCYADL